MEQQQRIDRENQGAAPGGLGDIFSANPDPAMALVSHGPYAEELPVEGMTVGEVRRRFVDLLDINPQAVPILDGQEASEDTVVHTGQVLSFTNRAGEKGKVPTGA